MAAKINDKTSTGDGVIIYRDHADAQQFYYLPAVINCELGKNLLDFNVVYYGIGRPYCIKTTGANQIKSIVGAILKGRFICDITPIQRQSVYTEIKKTYGVDNPKLGPLYLRNVKLEPTLAKNTLMLGEQSDVIFPTFLEFGTTINYTIGTGNSFFANYVANMNTSSTAVGQADFGLNITGDAEFFAEPWSAKVTCNLSQVFKYVHKHLGLSVKIGWFKIGSVDYEKTVKDLIKDGIVKIECTVGTPELEKFGGQIFKVMEAIFNEMNTKVNAMEGIFKFEPVAEPNPNPGNPITPLTGNGISIKGGYNEKIFNQTFNFERVMTYGGNVLVKTGTSVTLAVQCGDSTKANFNELGDTEPCITPAKVQSFQKRLDEEKTKKDEKLAVILDKWINNEINEEKYEKARKIIEDHTFTERCIATDSQRTRLLNNELKKLKKGKESQEDKEFIKLLKDWNVIG